MAESILQSLQAVADPEYSRFQAGLVPTVPPESILGVRIPALRKLARELTDALKARGAQRPALKATKELLPYPDGSR